MVSVDLSSSWPISFAVTNPTASTTSPFLYPNPLSIISYSDISNKVDPIPVTGLTIAFTFRPVPVSVVGPIPSLDTPLTDRLEYDGSETIILGSL